MTTVPMAKVAQPCQQWSEPRFCCSFKPQNTCQMRATSFIAKRKAATHLAAAGTSGSAFLDPWFPGNAKRQLSTRFRTDESELRAPRAQIAQSTVQRNVLSQVRPPFPWRLQNCLQTTVDSLPRSHLKRCTAAGLRVCLGDVPSVVSRSTHACVPIRSSACITVFG